MKIEIIYKSKFYKNIFVRVIIKITIKCSHIFDYIKDKHICGCSLVKFVPTKYRETHGATGSQSTSYWALDKVFAEDVFSENDSFVDIGCGKGRVLAYLIRKKVPCKLYGIELNKDVAEYAQKWASRYESVNVLNANALNIDYNDFTVLFLARPFEPDTFFRFIEKIENELKHSIRFYYYCDSQSGSFLEKRMGWKFIRRDWIFVSHGLFLHGSPQRYTVWEYTPQKSI